MIHFCECGCGKETKVSAVNDRSHGYIAGRPRRFVPGHYPREKRGQARGARHGNYKDGTTIGKGYRLIRGSGAPKREHIAIAEAAMGRPLPRGAHVHHVNGDKLDNQPSNLVVCQDAGYHAHLHKRQRALDATGNADARKCRHCHQWDAPENMHIYPNKVNAYHRACKREYDRERSAVKLRARLAVAYAVVGEG